MKPLITNEELRLYKVLSGEEAISTNLIKVFKKGDKFYKGYKRYIEISREQFIREVFDFFNESVKTKELSEENIHKIIKEDSDKLNAIYREMKDFQRLL